MGSPIINLPLGDGWNPTQKHCDFGDGLFHNIIPGVTIWRTTVINPTRMPIISDLIWPHQLVNGLGKSSAKRHQVGKSGLGNHGDMTWSDDFPIFPIRMMMGLIPGSQNQALTSPFNESWIRDDQQIDGHQSGHDDVVDYLKIIGNYPLANINVAIITPLVSI